MSYVDGCYLSWSQKNQKMDPPLENGSRFCPQSQRFSFIVPLSLCHYWKKVWNILV